MDEPSKYEASLRRAFVDHYADYIVITSRRERFQIESASYGIEQGWLSGYMDERDEQSSAWILRLTEKGKEHFGLTVASA
jgi:hypothetical protein